MVIDADAGFPAPAPSVPFKLKQESVPSIAGAIFFAFVRVEPPAMIILHFVSADQLTDSRRVSKVVFGRIIEMSLGIAHSRHLGRGCAPVCTCRTIASGFHRVAGSAQQEEDGTPGLWSHE